MINDILNVYIPMALLWSIMSYGFQVKVFPLFEWWHVLVSMILHGLFWPISLIWCFKIVILDNWKNET